MNQNPTTSEPDRRPVPGQTPARKSVLLLSAAALLAAIVILIIARRHSAIQQQPPGTMQIIEMPQASDTASLAPGRIPPAAAPALASPAVAATPTNSDRSAVARELVKQLSEIETQPGGVTPESATKWRQGLEGLIEQGTAAIAPLDEFFQTRADVKFNPGNTNLLGEPTLRIAFIKVLFDIPTPDNLDLQERLLRNTSDPAEVALLARQLESQEPGKYQGLIAYAAQLSLEQASHGQWPGSDTAPLQKILKSYDGASAK